MSIARIAETIENPSVPQLLAAYPTKDAFDTAFRAGKIKRTQESGAVANIFNRIVDDALAKQAQVKAQTTVMQDLTAPRQPMGLVAAAQPQAPQQPQMQQPVMARGGGLTRIPIRDNMYEMAGGGIVAFQKGGEPEAPTGFAGFLDRMFGESRRPMPLTARREELTEEELKEYERLKNLGLLDSAKETADKLGVGLQDFIKDVVSTQKKAVGSVVNPVIDYFSQSKSLRERLSPTPSMPEEPGYVPQASAATPGMVDPFSATETSTGDPALSAQASRNREALAAAQQTNPMAGTETTKVPTTQQAAAQQAAVQPPVTEKVPEKKTMEQLIAERTALYGEDPRKAAMKAALEKAGKESESDRILDALRLISAGEEKRTKGTTKELESVIAAKEKKKAAAEQRAYKAADIEGMDYDTRRKAIDSILSESREDMKSKADRDFRVNLLAQELTAKEGLSKKEIAARIQIAQIAADSRPEQFLVKALEILEKGTDAQKAAVREVMTLQGKGDLLSRIGTTGPDIKGAMASKFGIEPTR
jgi:hypothetical protein